MIRDRRARIVATLGPASSAPQTVLALAQAGVDVFRLNFSHGSQKDHQNALNAVRAAEGVLERPLGVLADLQGPKLRLGEFEGGSATLADQDMIRLDLDPRVGNATRVCLPHREIFAVLKPGIDLLVDDGRAACAWSIAALISPTCGPSARLNCPTTRASTCPARRCRSRP
jgi:pyruvate kinase